MKPEIKKRVEMIRRGEVPPGYKKINAWIIPENWRKIRFSKIAEFKNGLNFLSGDSGYQYDMIGVSGFKNYSTPHKESFEKVNISEKLNKEELLSKGDLLFVRSNGNKALIGRCLFIDIELNNVSFSGFTIRARITNKKFNEKFISIFMRSKIVKKQFLQFGGGTNISNLTQEILGNIEIFDIPKEEQFHIAEILSCWDKAIEKQEKLIELKKKQKKRLSQNLLFGNPQYNNQVNWEKYSIKDLLIEINKPIEWDDDHKYRLVSIKRRSEGMFFREELYGNEILTKNLNILKENDFVISKMQIVHGASAIVKKEFNNTFASNSYIILNSKNTKILDIHYFNELSKTPFFYNIVLRSCYGVHIEKMTFNIDLFFNEKIAIPPLQIQKKIIDILSACEKDIELLEKELYMIKEQKKGLMELLLTGIVRVK